VLTIVDVAFGADSPGCGTIGIDAFGDAAVEGVVCVINLAGNRAPSGGPDNDAGEAVVAVPGGVGDFSSCDIRTAGAVSLPTITNRYYPCTFLQHFLLYLGKRHIITY
jgi:hypothetical protein